jgi:hypothetical protein
MSGVVVEFYGMARARAGRAELRLPAESPREALQAVTRACPVLSDVWAADGKLARHYLLSLDGERFLTDLDEPLPAGVRLLLLSAEAGG